MIMLSRFSLLKRIKISRRIKMKKKILVSVLAIVLCAIVAVACFACAEKSDLKKIEKNGYFICGVTVAAPMNYKDGNDKWIGFDTEFAQAVAKKLGVEVQFKQIDWGQKYVELNSGAIDCIWNGFTANCADDDGIQRGDKVDLSYFYMDNQQCVVTKAENVEKFKSAADLAGKKAGAEKGSAGAAYVADVNASLEVSPTSQLATLIDLKMGGIDFVVIDNTLAKSVVGKGDYSSLSIVEAIQIEGEKYAIGLRKGSDLTEKINAAMIELVKDGTLNAIATKYGVENVLVTDFAD